MTERISPARMAALAVLESLYNAVLENGETRQRLTSTERGLADADYPDAERPDVVPFVGRKNPAQHVAGKDAPLPVVLDAQCRRLRLDSRDAALTSELVYGVLRSEKRLSALLHPFLRKPESLPSALRLLLLMAAYELTALDQIPQRATLHQSVDLAKKRFGSAMGGLANAVLRSLTRADTTLGANEKSPCAEKINAVHGGDTAKDTDAGTPFDRQKDKRPSETSSLGGARKEGPKIKALSEIQTVALAGSLPDWLAELWLKQYGDDAITFARQAAEKPLSAWRLNASLPLAQQNELKAELSDLGGVSSDNEGVLFPASAFADRAVLTQRLAELERMGRISRQGSASQKVAERVATLVKNHVTPGVTPGCSSLFEPPILEPFMVNSTLVSPCPAPLSNNAPLWDACCGRGGKTCALLERGVNVTLASDPSTHRLEALRGTLDRLGLPVPEVRNAELAVIAEETRAGKRVPFPFILLDAPCSGTGTLARNPELRLRLTSVRLHEAERLQAALLDDAWAALASGGLLFYATCALNRKENEDQIAAFLARTPDSMLVEQHLYPPSEHSPGQDVLFFAVLAKKQVERLPRATG